MRNTLSDPSNQRGLVLLVAWLGWLFDSMDATIYTLVLTPALNELLGPNRWQGSTDWYGGIILSLFLVAWGLGGISFGILADYFGRVKVLAGAVLIYATFTGLAGFSHSWPQLAAYRFVAGIGIGGEWAAGATLVAEIWAPSARVKAAGFLQSAWSFGFFLSSLLNWMLAGRSWRAMFFFGFLPALLVLPAIRLRDSPDWRKTKNRNRDHWSLGQLFSIAHRRDTLVGSGLAAVAIFGAFGAMNWTPSILHEMLQNDASNPVRVTRMVSAGVMVLNAGSIAGYLVFPRLAERLGRRWSFFTMLIGCLTAAVSAFLWHPSYWRIVIALPFVGFFCNGIFSGFPIYLPELFPTQIRATGAGFCYSAGRFIAAAGPLITGYLVAHVGSLTRSAGLIAFVYIFGLIILIPARETKGGSLD